MTIGQRVRGLRLARGLTQAELAQLLGYKNASAVGDIEADRRPNMGRGKLEALASVLGVSVQYLLSDASAPAGTEDIFEQLRHMPLGEDHKRKLLEFAEALVALEAQEKQRKGRTRKAAGESEDAVGETYALDQPKQMRVVAEEGSGYNF